SRQGSGWSTPRVSPSRPPAMKGRCSSGNAGRGPCSRRSSFLSSWTLVPWSEIDRTLEADHLTSLYLPRAAVPIARELTRLAELVRVLRARCPWDREQTHNSLVPHLLEETYETMEAIEALGSDPAAATPELAAHV